VAGTEEPGGKNSAGAVRPGLCSPPPPRGTYCSESGINIYIFTPISSGVTGKIKRRARSINRSQQCLCFIKNICVSRYSLSIYKGFFLYFARGTKKYHISRWPCPWSSGGYEFGPCLTFSVIYNMECGRGRMQASHVWIEYKIIVVAALVFGTLRVFGKRERCLRPHGKTWHTMRSFASFLNNIFQWPKFGDSDKSHTRAQAILDICNDVEGKLWLFLWSGISGARLKKHLRFFKTEKFTSIFRQVSKKSMEGGLWPPSRNVHQLPN